MTDMKEVLPTFKTILMEGIMIPGKSQSLLILQMHTKELGCQVQMICRIQVLMKAFGVNPWMQLKIWPLT